MNSSLIDIGEKSYPLRPNDAPIELSIVIVNFNTKDLTMQCLSSILSYPPHTSFEIIVVDNGSDDTLEREINDLWPDVKFIEVGQNLGFAKATNLGIHNSHGKNILLLNSDTRLVENTLNLLLSYLEQNPEVGCVGPRHVNANGTFQLSCGKFPTFFSEILRKVLHYRLSIDDYRVREYLDEMYSSNGAVDWVSGSCMMIRREVLEGTHLLDENFFMYFEDIDLCRRIWNSGWPIHFLANTHLIHIGGGSARLNLMKVFTEYRRSQIYFTKKYYNTVGEIGIRILLVLKYFYHLVFGLGLYALKKCLFKDPAPGYTRALLAKKIIEIALKPVSSTPHEPVMKSVSLRQAIVS